MKFTCKQQTSVLGNDVIRESIILTCALNVYSKGKAEFMLHHTSRQVAHKPSYN